mgnify:CR=1 FL=1
MATFTTIKNRGGGRGALAGVLQYIRQDEKTLWEGHRLVSGWNCTAPTAWQEIQLTKERFVKTDGWQYYHFVQFFAATDGLTPQEAHAIGLELAQRKFPDFEGLVATHIDTDILYSHLIVNSVSFQNGRKLHQSAADLQAHRIANDEICAAHGLEILPPPQKQVKQKRMSTREYRSAAKGESWKFRLMNTIDQCMRYAATREEFISLMESEGYEVRWTENRKNITYTTPAGMKCRDNRLHEEKYTKEAMDHEFRIRAAIAHGGIEAEERSAIYDTAELSQQRGVGKSAADDQRIVSGYNRAERQAGEPEPAYHGLHGPSAGGFQPEGAEPRPGSDGGPGARCGGNTGAAATGWEEERDFCFSSQSGDSDVGAAVAVPDLAGDDGGDGGLADDLVRLIRSLERGQASGSVRDATTAHHHTDKKTLRRQRQKKIALGHKEDDHANEPTWQQSM